VGRPGQLLPLLQISLAGGSANRNPPISRRSLRWGRKLPRLHLPETYSGYPETIASVSFISSNRFALTGSSRIARLRRHLHPLAVTILCNSLYEIRADSSNQILLFSPSSIRCSKPQQIHGFSVRIDGITSSSLMLPTLVPIKPSAVHLLVPSTELNEVDGCSTSRAKMEICVVIRRGSSMRRKPKCGGLHHSCMGT
jgi:hypothetical protein